MALAANGRAIDIAGKNLANVNNPDYARQRVRFGDLGSVVTPTGAESMGVQALGVEQARDALADQQVTREISVSSDLQAEQSGYQRAQGDLGQAINRAASATDGSSAGSGLGGSIDDLFNSFQSFASQPTDAAGRDNVLQKAATMADQFNSIDGQLAQTQGDLTAQVSTSVNDANTLLKQIADLNVQVGRAEVNAPGSAVDLRDQREARLEQLAAIVPVQSKEGSNGELDVTTTAANGSSISLVHLGAVANPVSFDGTTVTAGGTALANSGGSLQGALRARDGAIAGLRSDLDHLASQLVTSVNKAYNPTGTTGNFFDAAGVTAGTIKLDASVTADTLKASDGGAPGDNTIATAVAGLASTTFSVAGGDQVDGTFSGFYSNTVAKLGQALSTANTRVDDQTNIETMVRSQRDSISGVSLDEETADLMKFQRAFQASSRVFNVIDNLLDTVVNKLGT